MKVILLYLGGKVSAYNNALLMWHDKSGSLTGTLVSHVDNFAFYVNKFFQEQIIEKLKHSR